MSEALMVIPGDVWARIAVCISRPVYVLSKTVHSHMRHLVADFTAANALVSEFDYFRLLRFTATRGSISWYLYGFLTCEINCRTCRVLTIACGKQEMRDSKSLVIVLQHLVSRHLMRTPLEHLDCRLHPYTRIGRRLDVY